MNFELVVTLVSIFWLHFIGDFVFQTRYIADNKSDRPSILILHALILYPIPLLLINPYWALVNGLLHWPIDHLSSKYTEYFHEEENYYGFFTVIGADQAIHLTLLIYTYFLFGSHI
jgi:hypothetical protein